MGGGGDAVVNDDSPISTSIANMSVVFVLRVERREDVVGETASVAVIGGIGTWRVCPMCLCRYL
jgi:hypothetical protein